MTDKKYILFDLDGTISDSNEGITKGVQATLAHFGINIADRTELLRYIGPPIRETLSTQFGLTTEQVDEAMVIYGEYYSDKGLYENVLYDGVVDTIRELKRRGKVIALATSKAQVFAERILEYFGIADCFTCICGGELTGYGTKKSGVIRRALAGCGVADLSQAVIVGDRKYDIIGAKEAGIASVGVLYGFGDHAELRDAGADWIVEDIADLLEMFV